MVSSGILWSLPDVKLVWNVRRASHHQKVANQLEAETLRYMLVDPEADQLQQAVESVPRSDLHHIVDNLC